MVGNFRHRLARSICYTVYMIYIYDIDWHVIWYKVLYCIVYTFVAICCHTKSWCHTMRHSVLYVQDTIVLYDDIVHKLQYWQSHQVRIPPLNPTQAWFAHLPFPPRKWGSQGPCCGISLTDQAGLGPQTKRRTCEKWPANCRAAESGTTSADDEIFGVHEIRPEWQCSTIHSKHIQAPYFEQKLCREEPDNSIQKQVLPTFRPWFSSVDYFDSEALLGSRVFWSAARRRSASQLLGSWVH